MEKTVVADWLEQDKVGYWVGFFLSEENQIKIDKLLKELSEELPGILWTMPPNRLHVTLFEIIMSLRDYPEDKDELYSRQKDEIEHNLAELFSSQAPIHIKFETLEASPQTIIITGRDNGDFQKLRDIAVKRPIIQEGSRTPPDIIHSSIARYIKSEDLGLVQNILSNYSVSLEENVQSFRLCRVYHTPMETNLLKTYQLIGI
jgi:hypothetical protein